VLGWFAGWTYIASQTAQHGDIIRLLILR
jgi:hypothetical protein